MFSPKGLIVYSTDPLEIGTHNKQPYFLHHVAKGHIRSQLVERGMRTSEYRKTMREVVIGCVYVVATALAIMVLSRSAPGLEELKSLLNGNILWVRPEEIALVGAIYLALAVLHVIWRRHFHALSFVSDANATPAFLWEFFLYHTPFPYA